MSNAELARRGEDAAAAYLERAGHTIVARNWRCTSGEVDLVTLEGTTVVIVEVKTRRSNRNGTPDEAVSPTKQKRLARVARRYLSEAGQEDADVRFDVISIMQIAEDKALLRHHRAAFTA